MNTMIDPTGPGAGEPTPVLLDPILLEPNESPADHPCAAVEHYHSDLALLGYLLQDLRVLVRRAAKGEIPLQPYGRITWEVHGLKRRTVTCDPIRLLERDDFQIVGFLADRRTLPTAGELDEAELDVIDEFENYPGIVSYSSLELVDHQWANLVVHTTPDDREAWRHSERHIRAAEDLAPRVYHNVRIHNGCIPEGPIGRRTVVIESTKYWDYDSPEPWHAFREFPGGAAEIVGTPWTEPAQRPAADHRR
jgi:hypothetical protein